MRLRRYVLPAIALLALAIPAASEAKVVWRVKGGGFGHGVGMSQYGAYGYAKHGVGYAAILSHYYTGTNLGNAPTNAVRVLLRPNAGSAGITGATAACGATLNEGAIYTATRSGNSVVLRAPNGTSVGACGSALSATGGDDVKVIGKGAYRGAIDIRVAGGPGINVINDVDLESYVRGVVSRESPSSWPLEALKAQAVAARSFALTGKVGGNGFDLYDDTRSQVYGGIAAETASTDKATVQTAGQVVMYGGKVAICYFSSTSGGMTENLENSFIGSKPVPYLKGVPDPYDDVSPYHRWTLKLSGARMQSALSRYLKGGKLKGIKVNRRGVSPRIVYATIISTRGKTRVTGMTLKGALGLRDSWAFFKKVKGARARR
jgi:stage II sporulation protein D